LLAIHHFGDPDAKATTLARWNQEVPIDTIIALITRGGYGGSLASCVNAGLLVIQGGVSRRLDQESDRIVDSQLLVLLFVEPLHTSQG
jgi:hypothetical protein